MAVTGERRIVAQQEQIRARDLMAAGRPVQADRALARAKRLLPAEPDDPEDAETLARVLITAAHVDYELRGLHVAEGRLATVAELLDRHGLRQARVPLHNQRGVIALRSGRPADAVKAFDDAGPFLGDAPVNERCYLLLNRAVANMELGRFRAARGDLESCAASAQAASLTVVEAMAVHNLGYVDALIGDLPAALRSMAEARRIHPALSPGVVLQAEAEVLIEAGLHREADDVLSRAAKVFERERLVRDFAEVQLDRARCALALGSPATARDLARSAKRHFGRRGNAGWRRSAEIVLLQADLAAGEPGRPLIRPAERLRDELRAENLRLPARVAALIAAEARLAAGQLPEAEAAVREIGAARRADPITGRMHFHYVHARVDAATGRAAAASRRVRRALAELARYQASFGSIDLRTASAVHGRRLAELDVSLALDSGRPAAVFAAAERVRAVSSRLAAVRPPDDPVAADLLAELRQILEALRAVEQDKAASEPLLRKRRDLERQIVARSWTVSGSGAVTEPATLDTVQDTLVEQGRTMVMYLQSGERLSAVVVRRHARVYDLGLAAPVIEHVRRTRADLDVLAHPRLASGIRAAVRASLQRSLRELATALLAPLAVDGPLVLVSTGVLGQLPWASLPSLAGRPLVVAPSATKWLGSTAVERTRPVSVTALAGPDLGRGDAEAAAVGAAWPGAAVVHDATTGALVDAMNSATVLHVAAHGVHQPENPLFSSVRMVDGPVFAHELDQKAHAPEHVVLSACEVGLATIRPGDEALGLASVLLHLGTRSVIAGVARVGDEVAEQTMAAYHARLAAGTDSSVALADALADVDADVTPPFVNFGAAWAADLEAASPLA